MNALTRFQPAFRLRQDLDQLFDELLPSLASDKPTGWTPALDLSETDEAYLARFDLPGLKPNEVEVQFEDGVLTVRGERAHQESEEQEGFLRAERSFGAFFRSIRLPQGTDPDGIEAMFENGVLHVRMPKLEASQPRRIEVQAAEALPSGDGAPELV